MWSPPGLFPIAFDHYGKGRGHRVDPLQILMGTFNVTPRFLTPTRKVKIVLLRVGSFLASQSRFLWYSRNRLPKR